MALIHLRHELFTRHYTMKDNNQQTLPIPLTVIHRIWR